MACAATSPVRSSTFASTITCVGAVPASSAGAGLRPEHGAQQVRPIGQLALPAPQPTRSGAKVGQRSKRDATVGDDGRARRGHELRVEVDAVGRHAAQALHRRPAAAAGARRAAP